MYSKKMWGWCMVGIIIIAAFFRLYTITQTPPGLFPDEAMNGNNALEVIKTGNYKVFYPENNGREGLFINIQTVFLRIFKNEPWVLRLPSALFGILTVLGLGLFMKELAILSNIKNAERISLAGSLFLALNMWHIIFSRIGFRAIMAPLLLVWGLYFFLKSVQRKSIMWAGMAGIILGLGFYTYIAYRIMPLIIFLFIFYLRKYHKFWVSLGVTILFSIVTLFPLFVYFKNHPQDLIGRTTQVSVFSSSSQPLYDVIKNTGLTLGMFFIRGDANWRHNISGQPELFLPLAILFSLGIILALGRRTLFDSIMLGWIVLSMIPVVISNEGIPHALRSILMIIPVFGLIGLGTSWLFEWIKSNYSMKYAVGFISIVILATGVHTSYSYFFLWAQSQEVAQAFNTESVEIGNSINKLPEEMDKYIVVTGGGTDVRGIPMLAQTTMFITDSFLPEQQVKKHIHYISPDEYARIKNNLTIHHNQLFFIQ